MTEGSLPLADAPSLSAHLRRTALLRVAAAAALVIAAVVVVLLARGPHPTAGPFVPAHSNTIVVLDVSQSVELNKLRLAYSTLSFLGHSNAHVGLVIVSSYAYEALPPGSPANALLPIAKLFHASGVALGPLGRRTPSLPPNPWVSGFSAGTELASGLSLARAIVTEHHLEQPSVVLISDLLDDANDLARVKNEGQAYRRLHLPLRVVGLAPTVGDLQFFLDSAGRQGSLLQPTAPREATAELRTAFPAWLAAAACVLAALLAVDVALFAPFRWGRALHAGERAP